MKLIQKKFLKGTRSFSLENGRIRFSYQSISSSNEWFVNLVDLDASITKLRKRSIGAWVFTWTTAGFALAFIGLFLSIFVFIAFIPMLLGLYKALTESYNWMVINYHNGSPALLFHPDRPNKDQFDAFISEIFEAIKEAKGDGGDIQRSIETLNVNGLLSPDEYERLLLRSAFSGEAEQML